MREAPNKTKNKKELPQFDKGCPKKKKKNMQ